MKSHYLLWFLWSLLAVSTVYGCERDIDEDICPQREGYDHDCEQRCQMLYPMRVASGCYLRNTGTLLALFGIRSYVCKCHLPEHFCLPPGSMDPLRRTFSLDSVASHSSIEKLAQQPRCTKSSALLSCSDSYSFGGCGWQRSAGADWYEAKTSGAPMPFAMGEQPANGYLVAVGRHGVSSMSISTCEGLCSDGTVQITARIWKAPWVAGELCFRESGTVFCAPISTSNGRWLNETVPQTDHFQLTFRFNNVSDGDAVFIDDVAVRFSECNRRKIDSSVERNIDLRDGSVELQENKIALAPRVVSPLTQRIISRGHPHPLVAGEHRAETEMLRRRLCSDGECRTLSRPLSHRIDTEPEEPKLCIGRQGLLKCKEKCRDEDGSPTARCIRQKDYPFTRRCVCQARRSPAKTVNQTASSMGPKQTTQREHIATVTLERPNSTIGDTSVFVGTKESELNQLIPVREPDELENRGPLKQPLKLTKTLERANQKPQKLHKSAKSLEEMEKQDLEEVRGALVQVLGESPELRKPILSVDSDVDRNDIIGEPQRLPTRNQQLERVLNTVCGSNADSRDCDQQCKQQDILSTGTCSNGSIPICECSSCFSLMCDFEGDKECGWTDLRLVSDQFSNISIAAKKDQGNRYGLSKISPLSYSGLLRRGWVKGPVNLSVDVYPSETIDVRICVDSLHKCQSQSVAARSWNRVAAKIKVSRTDKIFVLFHNSSPSSTKTIAMDNISLQSGDC